MHQSSPSSTSRMKTQLGQPRSRRLRTSRRARKNSDPHRTSRFDERVLVSRPWKIDSWLMKACRAVTYYRPDISIIASNLGITESHGATHLLFFYTHAHTDTRAHTPHHCCTITRPHLRHLNWLTRTRSSEEKHSSGVRDWWPSCRDSFSLLGDGTNVWKCDSANVSGLTTHVHAYLSCARKPHRYVVSPLWALAGRFCQLCPQTHSVPRCVRQQQRWAASR